MFGPFFAISGRLLYFARYTAKIPIVSNFFWKKNTFSDLPVKLSSFFSFQKFQSEFLAEVKWLNGNDSGHLWA